MEKRRSLLQILSDFLRLGKVLKDGKPGDVSGVPLIGMYYSSENLPVMINDPTFCIVG